MKNWPFYAGIVLAAVFMFKIYNGEMSGDRVLMMTSTIGQETQADQEKPVAKSTVKNADTTTSTGNSTKNTTVKTKTVDSKKADDPQPFTVMAFGDVMPGRYVRTLMDKFGKDYVFKKLQMTGEPFYGQADVVFANLEGPIKGEGFHAQTGTVFGFNTDTAAFLKSYGFDIVSIVNNHAYDQKPEGRDTTIKALDDAKVGWCGSIGKADPNSVRYGAVGKSSYAFVCLNDVGYGLDQKSALDLIGQVKQHVDYLIVSIHWGYEYMHKPAKNVQVDFGHQMIDAGADLIIGHHPHVVESFENYKGKLIFYSLGNFVFDQYWSKDTQEELGVKVTLDRSEKNGKLATKAQLFPMKSERSQSRLMTDKEKTKWILDFIGYGNYDEAVKNEIRAGVVTASE